ncbi:MAG TPA: hypothetical protein VLF71_02905 [Candidatus Saccharimonadales bacterium]|nr:hypothetical protein [Candidatus Saccharimonadales bacterium]
METAHISKSRRGLVISLVVGGVLLVAGAAGAGFWLARRSSTPPSTSSQAAQKQKILQEVGDMYLLPDGENPTVAIIQDKSALGSESFFRAAQNGDVVIIYKAAGLGLIYRQSLHKLINVQTVSFAGAAGGTAPAGN